MSSLVRSLRIGQCLVRRQQQMTSQSKRNMAAGNFSYREWRPFVKPSEWHMASVIGFVSTFWMTYMLYNHWGHIVGEYPPIKPEEWTDEELGIPPDDEDVYPAGYVPLKDRI